MMKAAPASTLVVAKAEFLLEILIVPLDRPTQLAVLTRARMLVVAGSVERKYFVGSASLVGHSIRHHSSGLGVAR